MLATYILLQLLNVLWTSRPHSFQPGRTNILGSLIKAWNDSFNKRRKKKKSTLSLSHGIKAVKSSRARWHLAVLKPKWLVPVLEVKLELHSSLKFGVCIIIIIHGLKTPSSCLGYYMPPTLLVGPFFFFRCCCSSSSLFLRVLGLPCSLFRSWQFQFLEWFTFHR